MTIANLGNLEGADVAQLYVRFPAHADQPERTLRGFHKTRPLSSGEREQVCFRLGARDLSVWAAGAGEWSLISGTFEVLIGASSRDIRLHGRLQVD